MDQRLAEVSRRGDIDALYNLIREDAHILERVDELPFVNTPLHIAAAEGNIHFALEIMRLKPSFSRKLNPDGFSPIHLALQNEGCINIVIRMINVDRELVRVQGKKGITPLHYAAEKGFVDLVIELLLACPESILDVTIKKESVLHIAVKNNKTETVKVLLEWLKLLDSEFVLGWTDEESNNVLHIAASRNHIQMVKMLIFKVDRYACKRALDIMEAESQNIIKNDRKLKIMLWWTSGRRKYEIASFSSETNDNSRVISSLKKGFPWYKRWILANHRQMSTVVDKNGLLVVAVLIATTAYQAVISLPTIFDDQLIAPASHYYFFIYQLFNTAAFVASMSLIYTLLPNGILYMIQLVIPIIVCYFVGIYLSNLETGLFMFALVLFVVQLVRSGNLDVNENRRDRHALLKHYASFGKELQKKGYQYQQ